MMTYRYAKMIVDEFERDPYEGVVCQYKGLSGEIYLGIAKIHYETKSFGTDKIYFKESPDRTGGICFKNELIFGGYSPMVALAPAPTPAPITLANSEIPKVEQVTSKTALFPGTGEVKHRYSDGRVWVVAAGKPYVVRGEWLEAVR